MTRACLLSLCLLSAHCVGGRTTLDETPLSRQSGAGRAGAQAAGGGPGGSGGALPSAGQQTTGGGPESGGLLTGPQTGTGGRALSGGAMVGPPLGGRVGLGGTTPIASGGAPEGYNGEDPPRQPPETGLKVAFIGDQGPSASAEAVLRLIAEQGADAVLHAGDFDYTDDPAAWDARISAVLGRDFPYFASVGNHDLAAWWGAGGYQSLLLQRLKRVEGAVCTGDLGVNSACSYRGMFFVLSGVGTLGLGHEGYLERALASSQHMVKFCNWHKNQHDMQVGGKGDEVGWSAYQICQRYGAMIITGHEHSYARTRTLTKVGVGSAAHGPILGPHGLHLRPGATAVVVSGLGGHSQRPFAADHLSDTWWAAIYAGGRQMRVGRPLTMDPLIEPGALFIEFRMLAGAIVGHGVFRTISGAVKDEFEIRYPQ